MSLGSNPAELGIRLFISIDILELTKNNFFT